jgi:peptidoglycan/xylan/chitin deacetylase (PgdA/CDA1 family)
MYHSLDDSGSVISTAPGTFRAQMEILRESGTPVVPLDRAPHTPGSVAITFDDAFRNFTTCAMPVLQRYGFPATVFAVSGYCGKWNQWPPQPQPGVVCQRLMGWGELRDIADQGIEIGSHTVHHPDLTHLPIHEAAQELSDSRSRLSDELGRAVDSFAYPYGRSTAAVRDVAKHHYRLACGTQLAMAGAESDPFDLPRIDAYYLRRLATFRRVIGGAGAYIGFRRLLRTVRAAVRG